MNPNLGIVKRSDIIPLMEFSQIKSDIVADSVRNNGTIRNPLILTISAENKYFLLEEPSKLQAFEDIGLEYIPAQIVHSPDNMELSFQLFYDGLSSSYLRDFHHIFPRSIFLVNDNDIDKSDLLNNGIVVSIDIKNKPQEIIIFKRGAENSIPMEFFNFFEFIQSKCCRIENLYPFSFKSKNIKEHQINGQIQAKNLDFEDILFSIARKNLFPAGSLQFDFSYRILGIDFPISVLNADVGTAEKVQFFHELVNCRFNSGYSEFIKSGVYLLNY